MLSVLGLFGLGGSLGLTQLAGAVGEPGGPY